jgi:hypothetical protein
MGGSLALTQYRARIAPFVKQNWNLGVIFVSLQADERRPAAEADRISIALCEG